MFLQLFEDRRFLEFSSAFSSAIITLSALSVY